MDEEKEREERGEQEDKEEGGENEESKEEGELQETKDPYEYVPYIPQGPLMFAPGSASFNAAKNSAETWSKNRGDPLDLVPWFGPHIVDLIKNQLGANFVLPPDGYHTFPGAQIDSLDLMYDNNPEWTRFDIDHMRFPIGVEDLGALGLWVELAYQEESGTTKFGEGYLLLTKTPAIAVKLNGDDDLAKDRLLHQMRCFHDIGVFPHRNPNILASSYQKLFMVDLINILKGADLYDLEFMVFGMKMRDLDSAESNAICGAIREQWRKLDRVVRDDPDDPGLAAPRNSTVDVSCDCGWLEGIIMVGGMDRRLASNNMAAEETSTVEIHQCLTGLTDEKVGSAEIKGFPSGSGDLQEHVKKAVVYSSSVRFLKGVSSASLGIPRYVHGMKLLFCTVARIVNALATPDMMTAVSGVRTELRIDGQATPKSALRYVNRHFPRLHPGAVLKKAGNYDEGEVVKLHVVPSYLWLGHVVKMLLKFKALCVGNTSATLSNTQKTACADLISALGISNRDTERFVTRPIRGLTPENATAEEFPWYWTNPGEAAAAEAAEAQAKAAAEAEARAAAQAAREAEWAATIARGEEIEWRVQPSGEGHGNGGRHSHHRAPIPPRAMGREPITRLNTPRRAPPQTLEQLKKAELKRMVDEVRWYNPRRGHDKSTRLYRLLGGGQGPTQLTVANACESIWERFDKHWRSSVILRDPGEPKNLPAPR